MRNALKLSFALMILLAAVISPMAGAETCTPGSYRYINTHTCCGQGTEYQEFQCNSTGTGYVPTGIWRCFPSPCF
jgi:hypothetical protein